MSYNNYDPNKPNNGGPAQVEQGYGYTNPQYQYPQQQAYSNAPYYNQQSYQAPYYNQNPQPHSIHGNYASQAPQYDGYNQNNQQNVPTQHIEYSPQQMEAIKGELITEDMDDIIRRGFVKKTLGLFGCQMFITAAIMAVCCLTPAIQEVFAKNWYLSIVFLLVWMPIVCAFSYFPKLARKSPTNYVLGTIFTVAFALSVSFVCSYYTVTSVFSVFGAVALMTLALAAFAMWTKIDVTGWGLYLLAISIVLSVLAIIFAIIGGFSQPIFYVYHGLGACLAAVFIVYDIQLIAGGRHKKFAFGIDDYAFGAISLYMDVMNLFLHLLALFGDRK